MTTKLPTGWVEARLDEFLFLEYGKALPDRLRAKTGKVPVYGSSGVTGHHDKAIVCKPSIIIGRKGSAGSVYLSHEPFWPIDTAYFGSPSDGILISWVYYKLLSLNLSRLDQSTAIPSLSRDAVHELQIGLPPTREQARIVVAIDELFAWLDAAQDGIAESANKITQHSLSVLEDAVSGKLSTDFRALTAPEPSPQLNEILALRASKVKNSKEFSQAAGGPEPPQIGLSESLPPAWSLVSLDQITLGLRNGLSKKPVESGDGPEILRISAVRPLTVDHSDTRVFEPTAEDSLDAYWVNYGDLLFTRYNGSRHLVGVCGMYRERERVLHPDKLIKSRTVDPKIANPEYLELALNAGPSKKFISTCIKTTAGQHGISGADLKRTPIPLPPIAEQNEIVRRAKLLLNSGSAISEAVANASSAAKSLRQSILAAAFRGELVPQDPKDQPASVLLERIRAQRAEQAASPRHTKIAPQTAAKRKRA